MLRSRYRRITFFFAQILFSLAFWDLALPRIGLRKFSERTRSNRLRRSAARFRSLAVSMGGVLIKVGQFLSSRVDVLPVEITSELADLQDEVPPEDFADLRQVLESEFQRSLEEVFITMNPVALAAASLGQVHLASVLNEDGSHTERAETDVPKEIHQVVVKIQRPNIEAIINTDLAALRTVGRWLERYKPVSRRANVLALMDEFTRILHEEIDYLAEAGHAETFAGKFSNDPQVRVPRIYPKHTTKRVLTLEDVRAIKINDYEAISQAGVNRSEVANRLFNTYLKQIFEDGFFHADPHPGNLFVNPLNKTPNTSEESGLKDNVSSRPWELTFVDFGMVGRVPPKMLAGMREMVIAVGTQDAARLVHSYQMLGVLLPGADLSLLERAEAEIFERFWGKDMSELTQVSRQEVRDLLIEFRELIYSLPFQIPEDLILLGRTVGILSGLCTGLDPKFNAWEGIAPFARKLISEDTDDGREPWREIIANLGRKLVALPGRVETILGKIERGELTVRDPVLSSEVRRLERAINRFVGSVILGALFFGSVQLLIAEISPLAEILMVGAGLALMSLLLTWHGK
jgi:predicted unusual protein kinase regulating ubiquinone biosynthesis (AarF/ABC1/UbiB family)